MPHVRLGRYRRYSGPAVVNWLADQKAGQWKKVTPLASVRTER
jgi:hypothetical protein